jgi:hypothetical protein
MKIGRSKREVAGRISERSRQGFAAEQVTLLQHLVTIQRETGWKTADQAEKLRRLWGLQY